LINAIEPLLIAISAVSFTISYYSLYVLPKYNSSSCGPNECGCGPDDKEIRKVKRRKFIFWLGLVLSIAFISYFEYQKYQSLTQTECSTTECAPGECSDETSEATNEGCGDSCDSTSCE
jgi:hypothetical protein